MNGGICLSDQILLMFGRIFHSVCVCVRVHVYGRVVRWCVCVWGGPTCVCPLGSPEQSDAPAGSAPPALCPAALSVSASLGDWQASLVWLHKDPASFEVLKTSIYASPWTKKKKKKKKHQTHLSPAATQADIVSTLLRHSFHRF